MYLEILRLEGTNNKGETLSIIELKGIDQVHLPNAAKEMKREYPSIIHIKIDLVYPDPEVIEIKQRMIRLCSLHQAIQATDLVESLFNSLDIKLKEDDKNDAGS